MTKFRIVKVTKEKNSEVEFYIERSYKFIFFTWWVVLSEYNLEYDTHFVKKFNTLKEAETELDIITQKITKEVFPYD